jgi:hypothetical protein
MAQYAQNILHFYCFTCKAYELKTSTGLSSAETAFRAPTLQRKESSEGRG